VLLERADAGAVREVEVHGRDGDATGRDRRDVRALLVARLHRVAVDAEQAAVRMLLVLQLQHVLVDALAEPRHLHAVRLAAGDVDVQQRAARERHLLDLGHQPRDERGRQLEVERAPEAEVQLPRARLLRYGDARQAEQQRLERRRDGAGVGDVVAEVEPVVDAGDDELRLEVLDQAEMREAHAVDRRAVGREAVRAVLELDALDPQRPPRRDRARGRRAVAVRRHHAQLDAGHLEQRAAQRLETLGLEAVVVRQEDPHRPRMVVGGSPARTGRPS
jgi:hypothetical protein